MNIKITYNWLLEYLDTDATPQEIGKYLSLCGPSVERIDKIDDDYVFDIEVTTNRIDMASVFGIAQEAQAILPQFGKKAVLKYNPLEKYKQDCRKISGDIYIDDKNLGGIPDDWNEIYELIQKHPKYND
jgi:phenylalanyl-tRNA synthetase beta subunit